MPSPEKLVEWQERAAKKDAIVPHFFEVFATHVILECGRCQTKFQRNLIPKIDEPTFVCPMDECKAKNWVPVKFQKA